MISKPKLPQTPPLPTPAMAPMPAATPGGSPFLMGAGAGGASGIYTRPYGLTTPASGQKTSLIGG